MVAFGDVVRLSGERSQDPKADGFERYIGLEHIEPSDLRVRSWGDISDGVTFTSVFRAGQVLFGKRRAYQRKVAVADFSGVCSGDIYVLEPNGDQLLPELLPFICQSEPFYDYVISMSQGGLSPRVNWKALAKYEFALPPLEEQRRIARGLQATVRCDGALLSARQAAERMRGSVALEMFARDMERAGVVLGTVISESRYGPRFSSSLYSQDGKLAQLRTTDISEDGEIDYGAIPLASLNPADYGNHLLEDRDVVISRSGTCGITAVYRSRNIPTIPAAFLVRLRATDKMLPEYLHEFFSSSIGRRLTSSMARGGVQKNISASQLMGQTVPCPGVDRQREVVSCIEELRAAARDISQRRQDGRAIAGALSVELGSSRAT